MELQEMFAQKEDFVKSDQINREIAHQEHTIQIQKLKLKEIVNLAHLENTVVETILNCQLETVKQVTIAKLEQLLKPNTHQQEVTSH
jgi:arsenate reductase-like glutaredoxin family protein